MSGFILSQLDTRNIIHFFFAKTKDINSLQNMFFYLFKSILQTVETNQKLATDLNVNIIVRK